MSLHMQARAGTNISGQRHSMQHCLQESAKVINAIFVYADNGLLDDKGLHRAVQRHQGHDGSPPGAQVLVHGQVVHLHQHTYYYYYYYLVLLLLLLLLLVLLHYYCTDANMTVCNVRSAAQSIYTDARN